MPGPTHEPPPELVRAPAPTLEQVRRPCDRVATRARRLVARRPWTEPAEERGLSAAGFESVTTRRIAERCEYVPVVETEPPCRRGWVDDEIRQ